MDVTLKKGQILGHSYRIEGVIGKGGGGIVYLAYHLGLQKYVVVKFIRNTSSMDFSRIEVDALKNLRHPNIPQVYDFKVEGRYVYTVMDYIEGTDLSHMIKQRTVFETEDLIRWFKQISAALEYMHSLTPPVFHCDIKPGNIIITPEKDAILIDFGIATNLHPNGLSPDYASPEQTDLVQNKVNGIFKADFLDGRTDMYSLAATFYHMMSGIRPSVYFRTKPLRQINRKYPDDFCRIIDKAMSADRADRYPDVHAMNRELNSMWKRASGYRKYVAGQIVVFTLSGLLMAGGVFQFFRGVSIKRHDDFTNAYNTCVLQINSQDYSNGILSCLQILNEQERELNKYPAKKGNILLALADSYFESGIYSEAVVRYREAARYFNTYDDELVSSYSGAIRAAMKTDDRTTAEILMNEAASQGVDSSTLKLLQIEMEGTDSNHDACIQDVEKLETSSSDIRLLTRAFLTAAEISETDQEKYSWLKKAYELQTSDNSLIRRTGYNLLLLAAENSDGEIMQKASALSEKCYRRLVGLSTSSKNDYLNLSTALRNQEKYKESLETLNELEISKIPDVDSGILWMYKAFTYGEKGDSVRTLEALREVFSRLSQNKVSEKEWNQLQLLKEEYNYS